MTLSEKTLEINFVRNFRHSHHFVWQGATLRDEAYHGWDVRTENLVDGRSFVLQFKRPYSIKRISASERQFGFFINNNTNRDQNQLLTNLAQSLGPMNVFYALPCIDDPLEMSNPREAVLWRTALIDLHQPNLTNLGFGVHKIEIICKDGATSTGIMSNTGLVYSDPRPINVTTVQEYKDWGFALSQLKELSKLPDENIKSKRLRIKFLTAIP